MSCIAKNLLLGLSDIHLLNKANKTMSMCGVEYLRQILILGLEEVEH